MLIQSVTILEIGNTTNVLVVFHMIPRTLKKIMANYQTMSQTFLGWSVFSQAHYYFEVGTLQNSNRIIRVDLLLSLATLKATSTTLFPHQTDPATFQKHTFYAYALACLPVGLCFISDVSLGLRCFRVPFVLGTACQPNNYVRLILRLWLVQDLTLLSLLN